MNDPSTIFLLLIFLLNFPEQNEKIDFFKWVMNMGVWFEICALTFWEFHLKFLKKFSESSKFLAIFQFLLHIFELLNLMENWYLGILGIISGEFGKTNLKMKIKNSNGFPRTWSPQDLSIHKNKAKRQMNLISFPFLKFPAFSSPNWHQIKQLYK